MILSAINLSCEFTVRIPALELLILASIVILHVLVRITAVAFIPAHCLSSVIAALVYPLP